MHMSDALLSPAVGAGFWGLSGAALAWCARKTKRALDDHRVPLMGVLGAFVFAAQMINFAIPGTGSSGHLGGGLLLALVIGPHAALLTISSVLVIQALFFADGGLLALGTNIFNLGVLPCFVGLPLFRGLAGRGPSPRRAVAAAVAAAVVGLELGAGGVVVQTLLSGRSDLSPGPFGLLMGAIHLPIAVVEGVVTAAVASYVFRLRPEIAPPFLGAAGAAARTPRRSLAPVLAALGVAALLAGGLVARFASSRPDGLEWSIERLTGGRGGGGAEAPGPLARLQEETALLPDYALPPGSVPAASDARAGTSLAGVVGALMTLALAALVGLAASWRRRRQPRP